MMRAPGLAAPRTKPPQIRRGGSRQDGDAGAAGDKVALLDALALARRGRDGFDRDRHQALIRIGEAAAPALGLAAATVGCYGANRLAAGVHAIRSEAIRHRSKMSGNE